MASFYPVSSNCLAQEQREIVTLMNRMEYSIKEYLPWCSEEEAQISTFKDTFERFHLLFAHYAELNEERVFSPLRNEPRCQFAILTARQAREMALTTIAELRALPFTNEAWGPKFFILRDIIISTFKQEEALILPWLRDQDSVDDYAAGAE